MQTNKLITYSSQIQKKIEICCPVLLEDMKFAAYITFSFIIFLHILLVLFLSLYIWLYVLYVSV
jgi:hypothetical protein